MKRAMQMLGSSVLLSFAPMASAHESADAAALKVASGFAALAGSEDNALALAARSTRARWCGSSRRAPRIPSGVPDFIVFDPPTRAWDGTT
jgi:hypothetical protein